LVDNRYIIPTEPGQIIDSDPKQYDPASGEQRPKWPAELYAAEGPWWFPWRQLQADIPETADGPGPIELEVEAAIVDCAVNEVYERPDRPASEPTAGPSDSPAGNTAAAAAADIELATSASNDGITAVCATTNTENLPEGHDELGNDGNRMEGPSEIPNASANKGKGIEENPQYDPRERLPPFLINTELGNKLLPAITRGYGNDPMAKNGVRKPFKWHREFIVLDDPSITANLRLYIPEGRVIDDDDETELRNIIIKGSHLSVGHQGADKSYMQCRKCFYWPNMKKDFDQYVQGCMLCQKNKDYTGKPYGDPKIMEIPLRPWESIAIDFLGPFNVSRGYQNIMVVMDRFSSAIILVPLRRNYTTLDVANAFLEKVYATYGLPASILSDRDARFTSKFWTGLHEQLGVELLISTSFHQNTNGQVERANRTIGQMLRIFTNNNQNDWAHHLWRVEHSFNHSPTSTMGKSPHEIMFGHIPTMLPVTSTSNVPSVNEYLAQQEVDFAVARDSLLAARYRQAHTSARRRQNLKNPFTVGQKAFFRKVTREKGKVKKLTAIWEGPYEILSIDDATGNCTLKLPKNKRIHPVMAIDRLKPFNGTTPTTPPPSETDSDEEADEDKLYEVKQILDHKREEGRDFWYVSWVGYGPEDNSWEPDEFVRDGAADAIYDYLSKHSLDVEHSASSLSLPNWFFWPSPDESFCSSSEDLRPGSSSSSSSDSE
jgi:hypothetical protein